MSYRKSITTYLLFAVLVAFIAVMIAPQAHAQKRIKNLNDDNITSFIERTTAISNGQRGDLDSQGVQQYLERHLHDDARFVSKLTYVVPGFPPQETVLSLRKEEFMAKVSDSADAVQDYANEIEILSIDISKDRKSATVRTQGVEQGAMEVQPGESVTLAGRSKCTQILMLSKRGVLQMFNATCETTIDFMEF